MLDILKKWLAESPIDFAQKLFACFGVEKWQFAMDGRQVERKRIDFVPLDALVNRAAAFTISFYDSQDLSGRRRLRSLYAQTRFRNDRTDHMVVDGLVVKGADIDFDIVRKGLSLVARVEFRYSDDYSQAHLFTASTSLGIMGAGALKLLKN